MSIDRLKRELNELEKNTKKLKRITGSFTEKNDFSYEELELIQRIFNSAMDSIKDSRDLRLAKSVLEKINWVI